MFKHPTDRKERMASREFAAPTRDQASTGYFIAPGDEHGVGYRTPVGTEKARSYEHGPIPMKSKCDEASSVI